MSMMKKYNFSEMIMPNYRNDKYFLVGRCAWKEQNISDQFSLIS